MAEIEGSFWDHYHFDLQWLLDANVPSVLRARKYQIGTGQEEVDQFKCIKCPYVSLGSCQHQGSWKVGVTVPGAAGYGTGQEGRWVPGIDGTDSLAGALGLQNLSHTWARLLFSKPQRDIKACYFGRCCKLFFSQLNHSGELWKPHYGSELRKLQPYVELYFSVMDKRLLGTQILWSKAPCFRWT